MIIQGCKEKDCLEVTGVRFYGEIYQKLVAAPDRKRFKDNRFIFLNTKSNIKYFIETFEHAQWVDEAEKAKNDFHNFKLREKQQIENKDKKFVFKDYPNVFKTKPMDHQFKCFEISKDLPYYGLFFEQGCGKTKPVIDTACYLFQKKEINAIVVLAPNGVHKNWLTEEMPKHCIEEYDEFLWDGKLNENQWKNICKSKKLKIFSFNIECFTSKPEKQRDLLRKIIELNNCLLVIDESQTIKNQDAKRTKFLVDKISKLVKYKRIMTGTPATNGIQNLYTQFKFLSPDIIGIASYYAFKAKYCTMGGYQMRQIIGYKSIEELQEKIQAYSMRVLKKDCLDLPEKIYQREPFDLTTEQQRIYNEIKEEGLTFIREAKKNKDPITLDNALARMKKMQQITLGYLLNIEEKKIIEIVPPEKNPRLLKLLDLLERINGKVIIWTIYSQDIVYLSKMLGSSAVRYDGKITADEKEQNKMAFKNNPKIKYLIANTAAMARGHTLTEATTSIYYCNSFDLELRLQSEDRNHRQGTKSNVLYIDLEANKTLDKKIIRALKSKKKLADMILQDPESFFMEEIEQTKN